VAQSPKRRWGLSFKRGRTKDEDSDHRTFYTVLIAAAPAVLAQNVSSKTPDQQHHASKKHPRLVSGYAPRHAMHAKGFKTGYSGAFGYAPSAPKDYTYEISRIGGM
jgi:hypothetical protein